MSSTDSLSTEEKQGLKAIQIIFFSIAACILLLLFGAIVFNYSNAPLAPELRAYQNWLIGGTVMLSFVCSVWGRQRFVRSVATAKTSLNPLVSKLASYRSALIIYMAINEMPIILCIVLSVMTGNSVFQIYAAVMLGFMLSAMPGREKVISQLQ